MTSPSDEPFKIKDGQRGYRAIDLSKIDFEALIDAYNAGSRNIDDIFRDLLALSRALTEEQGRHQ